MPPLQVKDCPTEVYESLRACAARQNRSIAQQTLTIIEEYLGIRPSSKAGLSAEAVATSRAPEKDNRPQLLYSNEDRDGIDYAAKHRKVFEELEKLPPIPISDRAPRADIILAQIREEEAR